MEPIHFGMEKQTLRQHVGIYNHLCRWGKGGGGGQGGFMVFLSVARGLFGDVVYSSRSSKKKGVF